jgi:hypothetical protein
MTWKDCPVKCGILFHNKFERLMQKYILFSIGVIGKVEHVIQYELQDCGSIHVHVILWLGKEDIERISNEIIAFVHAPFDENTNKFLEPIDNMQKIVYKLIIHKQVHSCHNTCMQKKLMINAKLDFFI